jgi:hypothetical protein
MAMGMQEISDRLEINNLLIDYCCAIDAGGVGCGSSLPPQAATKASVESAKAL